MDEIAPNDEDAGGVLQPNDDAVSGESQSKLSSSGGSVEGEEAAVDAADDFDWQELQESFSREMQEKTQQAVKVREEYEKLMNFYNVWAETPATHEQQRASKRLKTRIAYVQAKERQLEEKRQHHAKVVKAFQSALDLLDGP